MADEITHREALAALPEPELIALKSLTDGPGLRHLVTHLAALGLTGWAILTVQSPFLLAPLLLVHGVLLVFVFTPLHETIHGTAFRSAWLNEVVAHAFGFVMLLPPRWFRYFHLAHHRHTQDPDLDPELSSPKPKTMGQYLWKLTGIEYWTSLAKLILRASLGRMEDSFVPPRGRPKVIAECRAFLAAYIALAMLSVWLGTLALVWLWVLPAVLGQPFLRAYLMAEHTGLPQVSNMLTNSRTMLASWPVQWLAWNMPHHAAHHTLPSVPFHRLPALTASIRDHLGAVITGYPEAHRHIRRSLDSGLRIGGPSPNSGRDTATE